MKHTMKELQKQLTPEELRKIRFDIIVGWLKDDEKLYEMLKVYFSSK